MPIGGYPVGGSANAESCPAGHFPENWLYSAPICSACFKPALILESLRPVPSPRCRAIVRIRRYGDYGVMDHSEAGHLLDLVDIKLF